MRPEHERIKMLARSKHVRLETLAKVPCEGHALPIDALVFGTGDRTAPTFGLFAGVHGLEVVGTHVVLSYLESFAARLAWDEGLAGALEKVRLVALPLVNPGGLFLETRSNPRGVDLMRNAPVDAAPAPPFLVGGHRYTPRLPWFRGEPNAPMEIEARALVDFVRRELFEARTALALDLHSGFGFVDRLWHPYAKSKAPFPNYDEARALSRLLAVSHPHHPYVVEPQSLNYTTHGDLWDFLVDEHVSTHKGHGRLFLPWTLEMGSWIWLRKNPRQILKLIGAFNPMEPHRHKRIMRRHFALIEFFFAATRNDRNWR